MNNIFSNTLSVIVEKELLEKGVKYPNVYFMRPVSFEFGDITTNVAMQYANKLQINPLDLAMELAEIIKKNSFVKSVEVINPGFINVTLVPEFFFNMIKEIILGEHNYGRNNSLNGKVWAVEHTSPNPNKGMHLGHLRNNLIGMGIVRLLKWNGATVITDAVDNNRGIVLAKVMYGFLSHMRKSKKQPTSVSYWIANKNKWYTPKEKEMDPSLFISECYVLGENDSKNEEVKEIINNYVLLWEEKDINIWKLWKHVLKYAYDGRDATLSRIGSNWDYEWHEHEHYAIGKEYVSKGLKEGIFERLDDGAVLTNLDDYNLPNTILLKKDGTSLYITQDIALTDIKKKKYKADRMLWIIGNEQSLAMSQLFAVCEQLGIGHRDMFTHTSYGNVSLKYEDKEKKMSSRTGNVVFIDTLIDDVKNKIKKHFYSEGKTDLYTINVLSEKVALAAIKFNFLKVDRNQNIIFDIKESIQITGSSGVYVLYTYVRAVSLIRKKKFSINNLTIKSVGIYPRIMTPDNIGSEKEVLQLLMLFPHIIEISTDDLSVHHIAQYLLELSSAFNSWYGKEKILDGSSYENYKINIANSVAIVIKNGLKIMGIKVVEQL